MPKRLDVLTTKLMLQNWMRGSDGPSLRTLLAALADNCTDVAFERQGHILTRDEAEQVWMPTAEKLRTVLEFVEEATGQIPNREIPDATES